MNGWMEDRIYHRRGRTSSHCLGQSLNIHSCTLRVSKNTTSRFKKVENGNYAVDIGKQMGFSMVNIGGLDIVDKQKKLILAIIWQLMRKYVNVCGSVCVGK